MKFINKNEIFLLEEIVKKNFSAKYKDSVLGIMWSVLKPLLMMVILTIIFSTLFVGRVKNYPVYLLSGRCVFDFFSAAVGIAMSTLNLNKNILKSISAPKHIFVLGSIISEFLNFLITVSILLIVMWMTHASFYWNIMILSIIPIISVLILVIGLGLMLSIMAVYYTDVRHLWGVISMILMYGSAIFYPMNIIPEPYYSYLLLNPVYWIIDQFRCTIYMGILPDNLYMINSLLLSTIILVIGIIIFKKYEKRVAMKF